MKIYKWERLKDEAAYVIGALNKSWNAAPIFALMQSIEQQITGQPVKNWRDNVKEMIEKAQSICDDWDIRQADKLLKLFPIIIAKKHRGKDFVCGFDEKGNWCLCFK